MHVARHVQIIQNNKFFISQQYLKKDVSDEADSLHAWYKLIRWFWWEWSMARRVQSTQNRKLVIFSQCVMKNVLQRLHCFIVTQNIMIFHWCPVMLVVTCFWVVGVKNWCSLLDHGFLKSATYISRMNRWNELIFFMLIQM